MSEVLGSNIDPGSIEAVYIKGGLPDDQKRRDLVMGRSLDGQSIFIQVCWASNLVREIREEQAFQRMGLAVTLVRWPENMVGDTLADEIKGMVDECRRSGKLGFKPARKYILDIPVFSLSDVHPSMVNVGELNGADFGIWEQVSADQYELYRRTDNVRLI